MGMGSMGGLYIGVSGLQVNQTALNATGHNLANLDSQGYTRQQVLIRDSSYIKIGNTAVSATQTGTGATMEKVRQVRDYFADKQYRFETGREEFYSSMSKIAEEVENYFGSDVEEQPVKSALTQFWNSLNELQKQPDSIVNRENLVLAAEQIVEQSRMVYDQITTYQMKLNEEIDEQVASINEIANEILSLNREIVKVEGGKVESANDLRDRRNYLLDKLAGYGEISYREEDSGCMTINFEGTSLVAEDRIFELGTQTIEGNKNTLLTVVWKDHGNLPVYSFKTLPGAETLTDVGSLKGLLYARGSIIANYTNMTEESIDWESIDDSFESIEDFYTANNLTGYAEYYNKNIGCNLITDIETQFDFLVHTIVTKVNDILCPNTNLDQTLEVKDVNGNTQTISAGTVVLDTEIAPISLGNNGVPGTELFSRKNQERYTKYTYTDDDGKEQTLYVYNEEDPMDIFSQYTIDQLEVNRDIIKNPSLLPISNLDHSNAQDVVNDLLDAWSCEGDYADTRHTLTPNTLTGYNIQEYYNAICNNLANIGNSYYNISQNQAGVAQQLDNRRQVVAGVNSDDELSNMIQFQYGYNAASRYINVVAEMLDTLINKL